jgi:ABC-type antimicrobial peptide transport system permease subunit
MAERLTGNVMAFITFIAVFISCLGLFGLAANTAEQRTREIGIRKIMGASVSSIVQLVSREFLVLVLIANAVAWPVAYYAMDRWLENFVYHIELGLGTFLLAGCLALGIALLTVSSQALRAARSNPMKSLRYE